MLVWPARIFGAVVGWGMFALGCAVWALAVVPLTLSLSAFWQGLRGRFLDFTRSALRFYVRALPFMRVQVEGDRCRRPCVLVVNHQSRLDPIVMMSLEPRLSGPARTYLFRVPALRSILRLADFYPAEVGEPAPLARMRSSGVGARESGGALLFFPEGTRTDDGEIGAFRRGAFRLSLDAKLPIQPVVIDGLYDVLPRQTWIPRRPWRHPVRVSYLPAFEPRSDPGPRRSAARAFSEDVRRAMLEELARLRAQRGAARA